MFKKILLIVTNMIYKIVHSHVRKKYIVYNLQTIFFLIIQFIEKQGLQKAFLAQSISTL